MRKERDNRRQDSSVRVTRQLSGVLLDTLPARTLAEAREIVRAVLDIPDGAQVVIGDQRADEEHVIKPGEVLEFIAEAGKMKQRD